MYRFWVSIRRRQRVVETDHQDIILVAKVRAEFVVGHWLDGKEFSTRSRHNSAKSLGNLIDDDEPRTMRSPHRVDQDTMAEEHPRFCMSWERTLCGEEMAGLGRLL